MNKHCFVPLLAGYFIIASCNDEVKFSPKGKYVIPDRNINPLKGNIACVVDSHFANNSFDPDSIRYSDLDSICFDNDGNMNYQHEIIENAMDVESIFKIDNDGIHSTAKLLKKDSIISTLKHASKRIGSRQFETILYRNDLPSKRTIYTYDKNSFIVEEKTFSILSGKEIFNAHQKQENDNDGRVLSAIFYDSSGKTIGKYQYYYSVHYGPDSVRITQGNETSTRRYKYDKQGNILTSTDNPGEEFSYQYDNRNNWLRRDDYRNGKKISYTIRKYYYR